MLLHGDCLEQLKTLDDNSIDSLVTDPPAGIAFMGKDWDKDKGGRDGWVAWMAEVMVEAKRVMKPGAHGFVWALPRTSHWTATALEDAGFEIRDVVMHVFGSGFPKSHNVSKALDKLAGVERVVVGERKTVAASFRYNLKELYAHKKEGKTKTKDGRCIDKAIRYAENPQPETISTSNEAKQWDGWGTALKPAAEHWVLIRKPLDKGKTVAKNVLAHGTGGINVDGSRVSTDEVKSQTPYEYEGDNGVSMGKASKRLRTNGSGTENQQGRFPANFICSGEARDVLDEQSLAGGMHSAGSVRDKASAVQNKVRGAASSYDTGHNPNNGMRFGDKGGASRFFYDGLGTEQVVSNHSCKNLSALSVAMFLEAIGQATERSAQTNVDTSQREKIAQSVRSAGIACASCVTLIAQGLAEIKSLDFKSEVLPAIQDYTGSSEKCILTRCLVSVVDSLENTDTTLITQSLLKLFGCVSLATDKSTSPEKNKREIGQGLPTRFIYSAKASKRERNEGCESLDLKECSAKTQNSSGRMENGKVTNERPDNPKRQNNHPTVKPQKLMQYLVTMITPPGGVVLDPFMGSGSTGVAATNLGHEFIGIEQDAEYIEIAKARIINSQTEIR